VRHSPPEIEVPLGTVRRPASFTILVLGASAGGIHALTTVLSGLPNPFPVGIGLVLHLSRKHTSVLTQVLSRGAGRTVRWAADGLPVREGAIYAAPPDRHLEFDNAGGTRLARTAPVRFSRPSVDRLFISAADIYGAGTLAVLLSGNGSDGADGAGVVRECGGVVIAQDEASSEFFSMPHEAIDRGAATYILPLETIAAAVTALVRGASPDAEALGANVQPSPTVRPAPRPDRLA
jgi:two-component system chemotaxis response regulator CheB